MDIELQLRELLVLRDPGTQFTDGVMSRVGDAPRGTGEGIVRLADERARRRKRRILLLGVLVAGAAAAMLALVVNKDGDETAVQLTAVPPASAVPADSAVPAAVVPVPQYVIEPPPKAASPPVARPVVPPAVSFSVHVRPLNLNNEVEGVEAAQKFRDRLIVMLKAIPNLVLVDAVEGGNNTAEYEVRLRMDNSTASIHAVLVDAGPAAFFNDLEAGIAAEAQMSPTDRLSSQRARGLKMSRRRNAALLNGGLPKTVIVELVTTQPLGNVVELGARDMVRTLRNEIFPVDAAFKRSTLVTLRSTTEPFNLRMNALNDLLRIERRDGYSRLDAEVIRAGANLALTDLALDVGATAMRSLVWENMLDSRHPELVPQIARALDIEPDTGVRLRLIKILAGDFARDPAARKVLEVAARGNGQLAVRMAALRETQGEAAWQAYVATSLVDTNLPDLQRLQPIADMANPAMQLSTARLPLDDKALRELITLAGRNGTQAFDAILALKFVDNAALADRLIDIVRAPVTGSSEVMRVLSMNVKTAAMGVASARFPKDPRFPALLDELSASADPVFSSWAKDHVAMAQASTSPAAMKAYTDKMLQEILPK